MFADQEITNPLVRAMCCLAVVFLSWPGLALTFGGQVLGTPVSSGPEEDTPVQLPIQEDGQDKNTTDSSGVLRWLDEGKEEMRRMPGWLVLVLVLGLLASLVLVVVRRQHQEAARNQGAKLGVGGGEKFGVGVGKVGL